MASSFKYTAIGNNNNKMMIKKNKTNKKANRNANVNSPSGPSGTNGASLVCVGSNSSSNSGHHSNCREIRRGHLFCNKKIAHRMQGAVKFKLSEDLDRYETLISSEVYFIEWFPATPSLKVYYEFRFFSNIDDVMINEDFIQAIQNSLRDASTNDIDDNSQKENQKKNDDSILNTPMSITTLPVLGKTPKTGCFLPQKQVTF